MARVTHSLGFAVATTVLVAVGSATTSGQPPAQTQGPSRPSTSSATDEAAASDRPRELPQAIASSLFKDEHPNPGKPPFLVESSLFGVEMRCAGCGGLETDGARPASTNAFGPWALQGKVRRQTRVGTLSAGFVGVRNYALPLSTVVPVAGELGPAAFATAGVGTFLPGSQWSLTAGIEKTLIRRANGASLGIAVDLLVPVKDETVRGGDPRNTVLSSTTTRVGGVVRW